jgi:23S rRNA pseudouridine1911/1915/1917 synthase
VPTTLRILYEDNHLLAVAKPAGIATQGASAGKPSLIAQAKQYIKQRYRKPGNVYLGVVSRLDEAVSGVVIFARTSKAAARLSEQFRGRSVEKIYWACVEGTVEPGEGEWIDWIVKDEKKRHMRVMQSSHSGTQEAALSYRRLKASGELTLLEIRLKTGRKHQIRVQLSSRGYPIVGDRKYKARRSFPAGIALHCRRLVVDHPVKHTSLELEAPLPGAWKNLGQLISDC